MWQGVGLSVCIKAEPSPTQRPHVPRGWWGGGGVKEHLGALHSGYMSRGEETVGFLLQ